VPKFRAERQSPQRCKQVWLILKDKANGSYDILLSSNVSVSVSVSVAKLTAPSICIRRMLSYSGQSRRQLGMWGEYLSALNELHKNDSIGGLAEIKAANGFQCCLARKRVSISNQALQFESLFLFRFRFWLNADL